MYSKNSREVVSVKIPPGSNFDMLDVVQDDGVLVYNFSEMRNLIFYSDLDPLIIRNKTFIEQLIKQYYIHHRLSGGAIYQFLEADCDIWQGNEPHIYGKFCIC